jgi:hypothetical protein
MDDNEYDINSIQTIISKIQYDINLMDNYKYSTNLKHGLGKYLEQIYFLLGRYQADDNNEDNMIKIKGLNNIDNIAFQYANKEDKMYLLANRMINSNINISKINLKQEQELLRLECDKIYIKIVNELKESIKPKLEKIPDIGFLYKDVDTKFLITLNNYVRDIKLGEKLIEIMNNYYNEFRGLLLEHKDDVLTTVILYDISYNSYLIVRDKFKYENNDFFFQTTRFYNDFITILDSPKQISPNSIEKNRLEKLKKDEDEKIRREQKLQEKLKKEEKERHEKIRKDEELKQFKKKELDEAFKILQDAYESIQNIKEIKNDKFINEYNDYNYIVIE